MVVFIKTLTGKVIHIEVEPNVTLGQLKASLKKKYPTAEIDTEQLVFDGKRIDDDKMLAFYGIQHGSTLHAIPFGGLSPFVRVKQFIDERGDDLAILKYLWLRFEVERKGEEATETDKQYLSLYVLALRRPEKITYVENIREIFTILEEYLVVLDLFDEKKTDIHRHFRTSIFAILIELNNLLALLDRLTLDIEANALGGVSSEQLSNIVQQFERLNNAISKSAPLYKTLTWREYPPSIQNLPSQQARNSALDTRIAQADAINQKLEKALKGFLGTVTVSILPILVIGMVAATLSMAVLPYIAIPASIALIGLFVSFVLTEQYAATSQELRSAIVEKGSSPSFEKYVTTEIKPLVQERVSTSYKKLFEQNEPKPEPGKSQQPSIPKVEEFLKDHNQKPK